jgi:tRNA threonylcarbamoyl adenosine modification protein (Sua5/YciO/YrdC/YwlC family)
MTERFDLSDPAQHAAGMVAAAEAIRKGELIVLPTDTVYGVGADAFTPWAVSRLLAAKGRGRDMPPPVLVGTVRAASALVDDFGPFGQDLIDEFWPGGLTLVARATPTLAWDLGDTKGTVAVRMPLHAAALDLLKATGPMAVSSANTTGRPAATTVDEAMEQLGDSISVYLDGGQCGGGVASTIIDLTGSVPRLLRAGAISMDRLREVAALITGDEVSEPEVNGATVLPEPDDSEPTVDEAVPDGPPDIPSDSPADARADALTAAAAETPAGTSDESPAEQLVTDAGQAQLGADDPPAPVTTEDADAAPHPVTPKKPARARKPAAPRKPAAAKTSAPPKTAATRTTRVKAAETPAAETPAEAAESAEAAEANGAPAAPAKPAARKPAARKPAGQATTRRTAARKATAAAPAEDTSPAAPGEAQAGDAQPADES